jgi:hypothetical protein
MMIKDYNNICENNNKESSIYGGCRFKCNCGFFKICHLVDDHRKEEYDRKDFEDNEKKDQSIDLENELMNIFRKDHSKKIIIIEIDKCN